VSVLPIAASADVRAYARRIVARHVRALSAVGVLHVLAAGTALVGPRLIGVLVADVKRGHDTVVAIALLLALVIAVQAVLLRLGVYASAKLGERILAELREEFVERVLTLPLGTVEKATTGDLVTRMTQDVENLSSIVRNALPDAIVSTLTIVATLIGITLASPFMVMPCFIAVPPLWAVTRWYLARAREGYLRTRASYSKLTAGLCEIVEGSQTVEALGISQRMRDRVDQSIERSRTAERYTLMLRSIYLPILDISYLLPTIFTVVVGGWIYIRGEISLSLMTSSILYTQQLIDPLDRLLFWLSPLQRGAASLARIIGVSASASDGGVKDSAKTNSEVKTAERVGIVVRGVCYGYRNGTRVLHDINLEINSGEHLAVVGPSGAGKSTLARLLAGIYRPELGSVVMDGVDIAELPLSLLRRHIMLIAQEQHVFRGTLRQNLLMAKPNAADADLERALRAIDAWDWVATTGLDAKLGSGGERITPAQQQQLALARVLLADPHTLILDEATSLLDPRAARDMERSLAVILKGRTVISIAHQLHTAYYADRVIMMAEGRIQESGSHQELVQNGKEYASLWQAWRCQDPITAVEMAPTASAG
jgi:ABC-type multidrug transport system fused ATPase/permease subunit